MKFNKTNITKLLIKIQDNDGISLACNCLATKAIKDLKLEKLHQKLTKNPDSVYRVQNQMGFSELKKGEHFMFVEKIDVGDGIFNLVGIKKNKFCYRMGGTNRIIGDLEIKVIKTNKKLN